MHPVEIRTGLAEVLATGTVITFRAHPIWITFGPDDNRLTIVFDFVDDPALSPAQWKWEVVDPHLLRITLTNFSDPTGVGSQAPIKLGSYSSTALYVSFRVYTLASSDKTLHYTFYALDEARAQEAQRRALEDSFLSRVKT